jgi:hypothetical protein
MSEPTEPPDQNLDEVAVAKLAREMAMAIRSYRVIFEDFGISEQDFYEISKLPFYKRAFEQFTLEWNSALSTNERVKLISAAYLEQALPRLGGRMMSDESLSAATEVAKLFSRNAGLGGDPKEAKSNEKFVITINLGEDDTKTYSKNIEPDPQPSFGRSQSKTAVIAHEAPAAVDEQEVGVVVKRPPGRPRKTPRQEED